MVIKRLIMFRVFLAFLLGLVFFVSSIVNAKDSKQFCSGNVLDKLYAHYVIFDATKYGGGLTNEASAKARIGEKVILEKNNFRIRDFVVAKPKYSLITHLLTSEGEINIHRWSNFYGFGMSRESINVLSVYAEGDTVDEPSISFEILEGELWELYDGWLYKMKPSVN